MTGSQGDTSLRFIRFMPRALAASGPAAGTPDTNTAALPVSKLNHTAVHIKYQIKFLSSGNMFIKHKVPAMRADRDAGVLARHASGAGRSKKTATDGTAAGT